MRIRLRHHPVGDVWRVAIRRLRRAAREPRHREIETAPEKMHGADLADEARTEGAHHAGGLQQRLVETRDVFGIILRVRAIFIEGDAVFDLTRRGPDADVDIKAPQTLHESRIELGNRHRFERQALAAAVVGFDVEPVIDKIEHDVERAPTIGNCPLRHATRGDVKCHVPPMIDERRLRQDDLAGNLRP